MKRLWTLLWRDQGGGIPALSTLLLYTILVLGITVGLITLRDQLVQEYGDLAVALDHLDQSWSVTVNGNTRGFTDTSSLTDLSNQEPAGLSVQETPVGEGTPLTP
ncbi:MAG: hypothetical protein ACYC6Y_23630 [Thermoguttaceae bacterium]